MPDETPQQPLNWKMVVPYVFQYGFPLVEKLMDKWLNHGNDVVTPTEWNDLMALLKKTARSQMLDALSRAGIDPTSPQAMTLLAQVPE